MKQIRLRACIMVILAICFSIGMAIFGGNYVINGKDWALYPANAHIYNNGTIEKAGVITDRDGVVLAQTTDGIRQYSSDERVRRATLHTVGDFGGFIKTGLHSAYIDKLTDYNLIDGVYSFTPQGNDIAITLDSDICVDALEALGDRNGTIGVYNYKTGEVLCMVSTPTYDPNDEEDVEKAKSGEYSGVFLNKFLSGTFTPGSTFKIVTAAAAIDTFDDAYTREYTCKYYGKDGGVGGVEIDNELVTCLGCHGTLTLKDALAKSCNSYFSQLAADLGEDVLTKYAEKAGFNKEFALDGIKAKTSYFDVTGGKDIDFAWAGMGQYTDMMNPLQYLTFMGAIANEGVAQKPYLIESITSPSGLPLKFTKGGKTGRMLETDTANAVKELMSNNVLKTYGSYNFPGLNVCAKSGTAEIEGEKPHSVFVGFNDQEELPLAFVVLIEHGGSGAKYAGRVANTVLQSAKKNLE